MANPNDPREPVYKVVAVAMGGLLRLLVRQVWRGQDKIPADGGVIVVANHISYFDPPNLAHFILATGRTPRFLAKVELWKVPVLGFLGRACGHIPVYRNSDKAGDSLVDAARALEAGKCVAMYPEGTVTADPDTWPMTARPGAARLAFRTGCPIIPVGQFGAQEVMPGKRPGMPRFFPRKTVQFYAGDPIDLSDLEPGPDGEREACRRIETAITALVAEIRGLEPPDKRYDIRQGRRV